MEGAKSGWLFRRVFYQNLWNIVGKNVSDFIRKIWNTPEEIAKINLTYIYLIPKVSSPEFVNQFRPISLCNTLYKIVNKVIVNRLIENEGVFMKT